MPPVLPLHLGGYFLVPLKNNKNSQGVKQTKRKWLPFTVFYLAALQMQLLILAFA